MDSKSDCVTPKPGEALIKTKFIVPDQNRYAVWGNQSNVKTMEQTNTSDESSPKKKLKGQNKTRKKFVRAPKKEKLCPSLVRQRCNEAANQCNYEDCGFNHNISEYLQSKPPDVAEECRNFRMFGQCHYGLTCRYGSDHIDGIGNKVDEELLKKTATNPPVINILDRQVQFLLRRRKFDFKLADEAFKHAQQLSDKNKQRHKFLHNNVNNPAANLNLQTIACNRDEQSLTERQSHAAETSTQEEHKLDVVAMENKAGPKLEFKQSYSADVDAFNGESPVESFKAKPTIDWQNKLYLAPLTTVGNLPFRRLCTSFGADITCGEMAVSTCLLQGNNSEWALVKRHSSEKVFGVQLCGSNAAAMIRCAQVLEEQAQFDFIDINMGCPIDLIYKQGGGSALMRRTMALEQMVRGMQDVTSQPITLKMRTGIYHSTKVAHEIMGLARDWNVSCMTLHGRSREQRYTRQADWDYVQKCASVAAPVPLFGNGDIFSFEDYNARMQQCNISGVMIGRGALIKPWIFTEIKEQRHWDISSSERFGILQEFVNYGIEHWGSDSEGLEKTRRFLLEWLSFLHRYIPVGVLETLPQRVNDRPPVYCGRNDLETLMASPAASDWVEISNRLMGPAPDGFMFTPKHKANAWG